jgi:hypothetical protein
MLLWTIQITILSIILIFLVHYLIEFFKSTLTVPKIKDLVNNPAHKYENMYNVISSHQEPKPSPDTMKNDLKSFLKKQLNLSTSTDISSLDNNQYSFV